MYKFLATIAALIFSANVFAVPTLQLDIEGGSYVGGTEESVITNNTVFDLYAYGNAGDTKFDINRTYYISMALTPQVSDLSGSLGTTFSFAGSNYTLADMVYGTPPLDDAFKDIGGHGIYDTYYFEYAFMFDALNTATLVNVQAPGVAGSGPDTSGTGMYYQGFNVDMTNIAALGFDVHFDLYTYGTNGKTLVFAPFSHDAGTAVSEAETIALFAIGLLGLGFIRRRKS